MAIDYDDEPYQPEISCPYFDAANEKVDEAESDRDAAYDRINDMEETLDGIKEHIEEARSINSQLREWGYWWKHEAERTAAEHLTEWEDKEEEYKSQIADLHKEMQQRDSELEGKTVTIKQLRDALMKEQAKVKRLRTRIIPMSNMELAS